MAIICGKLCHNMKQKINSNNVMKLREAKMMSKAELARLVGVSRQRIHQLIKKAVASGTLREDPFGYRPQMIRHTNSVSQPTNLVITEVVA